MISGIDNACSRTTAVFVDAPVSPLSVSGPGLILHVTYEQRMQYRVRDKLPLLNRRTQRIELRDHIGGSLPMHAAALCAA